MRQVSFAVLVFIACLWLACLRAEGAENERLTWSPNDFLSQGYATAPWVRDPFYPVESPISVEGIISDETAFINGRWVKAGDVVEGYTVKAIRPAGVTLVRDAVELVVRPGE